MVIVSPHFLCTRQLVYWSRSEGKIDVLSHFSPHLSIKNVSSLRARDLRLKGDAKQKSEMEYSVPGSCPCGQPPCWTLSPPRVSAAVPLVLTLFLTAMALLLLGPPPGRFFGPRSFHHNLITFFTTVGVPWSFHIAYNYPLMPLSPPNKTKTPWRQWLCPIHLFSPRVRHIAYSCPEWMSINNPFPWCFDSFHAISADGSLAPKRDRTVMENLPFTVAFHPCFPFAVGYLLSLSVAPLGGRVCS